MSIPRLSFLYPQFFKPARLCESALAQRSSRLVPNRPQKQSFSTTHRREQGTYVQRYGSAAEPLPPPLAPNDLGRQRALDNIEKEISSSASIQEGEKAGPAKEPAKAAQQNETSSQNESKPKEEPRPGQQDTNEAKTKELAGSPQQKEAISKPLDRVLQIETPTETENAEEQKPPHLEAPRYVHHFDTYTLVRDLAKGGFTEAQSVTLMKAVRSLLAINMEIAHAGLVSKSDVENKNYLFRAACSELRTEILNTRKSSSAKMTTQRAHLQHEVDILSQRSSSESLALKDDLRGLLNDRKMAVRMEQQQLESQIQELNYKITVALNSDSKSEVEGLRWVLTRRAALAIAGFAFFILSALRYSSYKTHARERQTSSPSPSPSSSSSSTSPSSHTVPSREISTQTGEPDVDAALAGAGAGSGLG